MPRDSSSEIKGAFSARNASRSLWSEDSMLGKQIVHVVADAIAEVMADAADSVQPGIVGCCLCLLLRHNAGAGQFRQQSVDLPVHPRKVIANGLPDDSHIHHVIGVRHAIAHGVDDGPGQVVVFSGEGWVALLNHCGSHSPPLGA